MHPPIAAPAALVLSRFLPYRLSILGERISRAFGARYGGTFGLSIPEWRVMAILGERAPCTTRAVIEHTEMDRVKVSRAVIRLVSMGLVTQRRLPADGRAQMLALTARGLGIYRQIIPMARALETEFAAVLTPGELRLLDAILAKLHASAGRLRDAGPVAADPAPRDVIP